MKLSKSKLLTYESCPLKFKYLYVKRLQEPQTRFSKYARKGQRIHKEIENFFNDRVKIEKEEFKDVTTGFVDKRNAITINAEGLKLKSLKNFANFMQKIGEKLVLGGHDLNYIKPISQEVDYYNEELKIHGLIDAVFKHYKDGEYMVIDWKSGKIKPEDKIRQEMAFYKLCWDGDPRSDKPAKYVGMYFTEYDYLFLEEARKEDIEMIKTKINLLHDLIKNKCYEGLTGRHCSWCGFINRCPLHNYKEVIK